MAFHASYNIIYYAIHGNVYMIVLVPIGTSFKLHVEFL